MKTRAPVAALLLTLAGCAGTRPGPPPEALDPTAALDSLRARTAETRTLSLEGTLLVRLPSERHFVHFSALYARPDRFRLDLDVSGPLGFGDGRMVLIRRGDEIEVTRPDEEPIRGREGDPEFAFLGAYGLTPATAAYLVAPYAGSEDLFVPSRVVDSRVDRRSGGHRLVLDRPDGRREVLLLAPDAGDLLERRVVEPGGTVRLVCRYEYDEPGDRLAREVETRVIEEEAFLTARFRDRVRNETIPAARFDGEGS